MSNKSEATWHPNNGPEVPHADLIARLYRLSGRQWRRWWHEQAQAAMHEAAQALAERDTVPRSGYEAAWAEWRIATTGWAIAERERDEARAERDALAAQVKLAHGSCDRCEGWGYIRTAIADAMPCDAPLHDVLSAAPLVSLARHDAEVKAQALDEAADEWHEPHDPSTYTAAEFYWARAAAIRAEANDHSN